MDRKIKVKDLPMKCGQHEAIQPVYKKFTGKTGRTWLVPVGKFAGDNIHVSGDKNSQGYAGTTLKFNLEDGSTLELQGPWHGNPSDLFKDTGYDIRNKHATKVIIADTVEYEQGEWKPILSGILYEDEDFQESVFNRGTDLAKTFANKLNKPVYYYVETGGGSHAGWQKPLENQ